MAIVDAEFVYAMSGRAAILDTTSDSYCSNKSVDIPTPNTLTFDPDLGMRGVSESLISLHRGVAYAEDRIIGTRWFSEQSVNTKLSGMACRFAKYALLDVPVDYYTAVLAHEYGGHGARYRELDISDIYYAFDWPPPYGDGGGEASSSIEKSRISDHEELAIWMGGMEIHSQINRRLGLSWMAQRELHYRDASLYFWSWQIMFDYVQSTGNFEEGLADNDPRAYIRILNRREGYGNTDSLEFTVEDLQSRNIVNLFNPFVWISLYAQFKSYLYDGATATHLPILNIGGIGYLPLLRMNLAPFGPEYHWESYLRLPRRTALVDLRLGDHAFHSGWGGAGVEIQRLFQRGRLSLDGNLDIWKQPGIDLGGMNGESKGGNGGAMSIRANAVLSHSEPSVIGVLELGYKTAGFLEGYPLDDAPILMFGIGLQN